MARAAIQPHNDSRAFSATSSVGASTAISPIPKQQTVVDSGAVKTILKIGFVLLITAPITSRVLKRVREIRR